VIVAYEMLEPHDVRESRPEYGPTTKEPNVDKRGRHSKSMLQRQSSELEFIPCLWPATASLNLCSCKICQSSYWHHLLSAIAYTTILSTAQTIRVFIGNVICNWNAQSHGEDAVISLPLFGMKHVTTV